MFVAYTTREENALRVNFHIYSTKAKTKPKCLIRESPFHYHTRYSQMWKGILRNYFWSARQVSIACKSVPNTWQSIDLRTNWICAKQSRKFLDFQSFLEFFARDGLQTDVLLKNFANWDIKKSNRSAEWWILIVTVNQVWCISRSVSSFSSLSNFLSQRDKISFSERRFNPFRSLSKMTNGGNGARINSRWMKNANE